MIPGEQIDPPLRHALSLRRALTSKKAEQHTVEWSYPLRGPVSGISEGGIAVETEVEEHKAHMAYRVSYVGCVVRSESHRDGYDAAKVEEAEHSLWQKLEEMLFFGRRGDLISSEHDGRPWGDTGKQNWPGLVQYAEDFGRVAEHHAADRSAVETVARNLSGERVAVWVPPSAVVGGPNVSLHSLPAEKQVVVGVDLDLVEWAEVCPPTWLEMARLDPQHRAMLATGGVLKLLDPKGVFVVKVSESPWRSIADCPEHRRVLGLWRGQPILCEWSSEDDDGRMWWSGDDYHEGLTESGGPDCWMPIPEPPK